MHEIGVQGNRYNISVRLALLRFYANHKGSFMLIRRFVVWMLSVGLMVLCAGVVSGQDYPTKSIRMVVPWPPGGSNDIAARVLSP